MTDRIQWAPPPDYQPPTPDTLTPQTVEIVKVVRVSDPEHGWRDEEHVHTARLATHIDGMTVMELYSRLGGKGTAAQYSTAFLDAFQQVLHPDPDPDDPRRRTEYQKFREWTSEVRPPITELQAWFWDILGRLTDRPTEGPSNSADGPSTTGNGSTGGGDATTPQDPNSGAGGGSAL